MDTFEFNNSQTTYKDYYQTKHRMNIRSNNQPLLVNRPRKGKLKELNLIPELCVLTGLTEEMRSRFGREIASETKPFPDQRLGKTTDLIRNIHRNDKTREWVKAWDMSFNEDPIEIQAQRMAPGSMIIGDRRKVSLESPNIERDSQSPMLDQPQITEILLLYPEFVEREADDFLKSLKDSRDTYQYPIKGKPEDIKVKGRGWSVWEEKLRDRLKPSVTCAIFLLRGGKGKGEFYSEIKRFVITKAPVPSQVVLSTTISKGKNKRSIVNKILVQICAKIGGTPWGVDNLPFANVPTMCVGIDEYKNPLSMNSSIIGFCATNNIYFSRYFNSALFKNRDESTEENKGRLKVVMENALNNFASKNGGRYPVNIICFRNGVAEHQQDVVRASEMTSLLTGIKSIVVQKNCHPIRVIFCAVNKSLGVKFFTSEGNRLSNPKPGTIVTDPLTSEAEFYLISQNTRVGSPCPTHYTVLYNASVDKDTNLTPERSDSPKMEVNGNGSLNGQANGSPNANAVQPELKPSGLASGSPLVTPNRHRVVVPADLRSDLAKFAFKLAYLYFNTLTPVKVPAPVHYATRLCTMLANISSRESGNVIPHLRAENLFFI